MLILGLVVFLRPEISLADSNACGPSESLTDCLMRLEQKIHNIDVQYFQLACKARIGAQWAAVIPREKIAPAAAPAPTIAQVKAEPVALRETAPAAAAPVVAQSEILIRIQRGNPNRACQIFGTGRDCKQFADESAEEANLRWTCIRDDESEACGEYKTKMQAKAAPAAPARAVVAEVTPAAAPAAISIVDAPQAPKLTISPPGASALAAPVAASTPVPAPTPAPAAPLAAVLPSESRPSLVIRLPVVTTSVAPMIIPQPDADAEEAISRPAPNPQSTTTTVQAAPRPAISAPSPSALTAVQAPAAAPRPAVERPLPVPPKPPAPAAAPVATARPAAIPRAVAGNMTSMTIDQKTGMAIPHSNWEQYNNGRFVGDRECVALVVAATPGLGRTGNWIRGASVRGNMDIKPGTPIATFSSGGHYTNDSNGASHAAIYLGQNEDGIQVLDQFWRGEFLHPPGVRTIAWRGVSAANSGNAFSVVMVQPPRQIASN